LAALAGAAANSCSVQVASVVKITPEEGTPPSVQFVTEQKLYNTFSEAAKARGAVGKSPTTTAENATNKIRLLLFGILLFLVGNSGFPRFTFSEFLPRIAFHTVSTAGGMWRRSAQWAAREGWILLMV
jgi:hypothetical protein